MADAQPPKVGTSAHPPGFFETFLLAGGGGPPIFFSFGARGAYTRPQPRAGYLFNSYYDAIGAPFPVRNGSASRG